MRTGHTAVAVALAVVATLLFACSYDATDAPICGDIVLPSGHACVLYPTSCGCPAGDRCGYDGSSPSCEAPGTQTVDTPCATDSACATGTLCDGTRCRQTCYESLDCGTDETVACLLVTDSTNTVVAGVCHRDCDPTSPQAPFDPRLETCLASEVCHVESGPTLDCEAKSGTTAVGGACTTDDDCETGDGCVANAMGVDVCTPYCWVEAPSTCTSSQTCERVTYTNASGPVIVNGSLVFFGTHTLGVCL